MHEGCRKATTDCSLCSLTVRDTNLLRSGRKSIARGEDKRTILYVLRVGWCHLSRRVHFHKMLVGVWGLCSDFLSKHLPSNHSRASCISSYDLCTRTVVVRKYGLVSSATLIPRSDAEQWTTVIFSGLIRSQWQGQQWGRRGRCVYVCKVVWRLVSHIIVPTSALSCIMW